MAHILYVEDELEIGGWVTRDLTGRGYQVTWLTSGEGAEQYASRADIAVLDVMLPGLDGFSVGKRLKKEAPDLLTEEGRKAIEAMEQSIVNMDHLIDNLMAYTLLMANKYRQEAKQVDIIRFVKEHLATWYPLFEKEGFEVEVELGAVGHPVWTIDPLWMGRVLDNIYQNVLRHAKQGRYIHVSTEAAKEYDAIVIEDRGTGARPDDQKEPRPGASPSRPDRTGDDGGMSPAGSRSDSKGAGIGLSIVDRMLKGMGLDWDIRMTPGGTTIKVKRMNGRTSE